MTDEQFTNWPQENGKLIGTIRGSMYDHSQDYQEKSMRTIYKFPMHLQGDNCIPLEATAKPIHFAAQGNQLCLWVELNADLPDPMHRTYFRVYGTGDRIPMHERHHAHVMSCQQGPYVWHLYQVSPPVT